MDRGSEQILLQKRHTDGSWEHEKRFLITNHQRSANLNHFTPVNAYQKDKKQMLANGEKKKPLHATDENANCRLSLWKIICIFFKKLKIKVP